ncbi:hypothetical protein [Rhizobium halophytocola]|uniref:Uncharacterized protein n=1 Tax=Rhizobium halophytocola TaxID=735519 RepID=A0ABS4E444_9HYPH|nr:hypothetical protein [Rhizobium halophytocola]MBP1852715.1 hypothetical protein [Rhizobium halophytocola]
MTIITAMLILAAFAAALLGTLFTARRSATLSVILGSTMLGIFLLSSIVIGMLR